MRLLLVKRNSVSISRAALCPDLVLSQLRETPTCDDGPDVSEGYAHENWNRLQRDTNSFLSWALRFGWRKLRGTSSWASAHTLRFHRLYQPGHIWCTMCVSTSTTVLKPLVLWYHTYNSPAYASAIGNTKWPGKGVAIVHSDHSNKIPSKLSYFYRL